jgi:hypothetical protein
METKAARRRRINIGRAARIAMNPGQLLLGAWKRVPVGSFETRCHLDLFERPHYAYGVQQAALLARALDLPAISVVEFGVAGGNGLVALEDVARRAAAATGVRIEVYGFDRGEGLPPSGDYRDLPYTWRQGFFEMDVPALLERLTDAKLVLGDVRDTVPRFFDEHDPAPLGFVAVDLDLYSSTADALRIFDAPDERLLPRVLCYFDDLVGEDHVLQNDHVGELRAIHEFNEDREMTKLLPVNGLSAKRVVRAAWCDSVFAMHRFDHPLYATYVGPPADEQRLDLAPVGRR